MKSLRSLGPIVGVIGLLVLTSVAAQVSEMLPVLLIGLGLLGGSIWVWWRTRAFLSTAWNADGTVVALQRGHGRTRNAMFPIVQFPTVTGEQVTFKGGFGTNFGSWPVGQPVIVRYDPHRPDNARIQSLAQLWFLPALLGLLGTVFSIVGMMLIVA